MCRTMSQHLQAYAVLIRTEKIEASMVIEELTPRVLEALRASADTGYQQAAHALEQVT